MNFSAELINWYNDNKRDLPWRKTTDAYVIWLSEIILQQTRVEQGMPYFYRFAEKYPTVTAFAAAAEDEILRLWQGLGYYSRGRNMLKTARLVVEKYDGTFPVKYTDLIQLTGIGEYTAAAISSFSANEARAVVDGNVYRVLARYFGIDEPINSPKGKKMFQQIADDMLDRHRPATHNQAMMEFGAMLCKPKNPACGICPVRTGCVAFKTNATTHLPVKLKTVKVRKRYFNYMLISDGEKVLMNKRGDGDIWANMYDLPLIETSELIEPVELLQMPEMKIFGKNITLKDNTAVIKHVLTHQHIFMRFLVLKDLPEKLQQNWFFTGIDDLKNLAMPQRVFIFIKYFFNF
ncbi:A/G-specific adenine glycosylase [Mucilaginibacter phyllosphaerae]|uniref:Adenine DNA glycosylase n=1 Tax=Mucilaginibacter phyllosphaerae TaxID=1812349 RepID=A0A4Y8AEA8_9SPHI|nr:A/G-specific adenine glycosylase [Mucilaginibacter phyllosphaerae]MBB3970024.1 A/G-specific adenine glycosylase [Mucilaginibacter phyllosphaerae]TEW66419.1 A/G-specific adenine glycosylase [Mucilaginibacter phyllosphaerae]GGH09219.1 A/G-specific adenine glycosylase [Mucilaginibacter phyllosphaerae]